MLGRKLIFWILMGYLFRFSFSFLSSAASYIPIHHDAGHILIINFFENDKCWEENTQRATRLEKYIYNKFPLFCRKVTILHSLFFVGLPSVWQSFGPLPFLQPTVCCAASNFKNIFAASVHAKPIQQTYRYDCTHCVPIERTPYSSLHFQECTTENTQPKIFFEKYHLDLHVHVHKRPQSCWGRIGTHTIWTWLEKKKNPAQLAISKHKFTVSHRLTVTINFIYECSWTWEYKLKSIYLLVICSSEYETWRPAFTFLTRRFMTSEMCVDATLCKSKITLYIALFNPDVQGIPSFSRSTTNFFQPMPFSVFFARPTWRPFEAV